MRPIDANSLKHNMDKYNYSYFGANYEKILEVIDEEPTVVPVKHAHWIRIARSESEYWQCSNCNGYFTLPMPKYRGFYMRYCGCCGAKMDFKEAKTETD